jgi:hypothetical protein
MDEADELLQWDSRRHACRSGTRRVRQERRPISRARRSRAIPKGRIFSKSSAASTGVAVTVGWLRFDRRLVSAPSRRVGNRGVAARALGEAPRSLGSGAADPDPREARGPAADVRVRSRCAARSSWDAREQDPYGMTGGRAAVRAVRGHDARPDGHACWQSAALKHLRSTTRSVRGGQRRGQSDP